MPTTPTAPGQLGMATPFGELLGNSTAEMRAELADYAKLGVDWVRIDIHWSLVQPTRYGGYDWTLVDRVFNAIEDAGMGIVAVLNNVPDWVDDSFKTTASRNAFADMAGAAAARYGNIVDHWEIVNEPNKAGIAPYQYTALLKGAYRAIKGADSDATVITGGLAAVPDTGNGMWGAREYLEKIYAYGGKNYFDAVGYHPYTYPLFPSDDERWNGWEMMEDEIRPTMVANGDAAKKVWMTEIGAPTSSQSVTVSEADQARILEEAVDIAQDHSWAGPMMWFGYEDTDFETGFGLLTQSGRKKPAYDTYLKLGNADDGGGGAGSGGAVQGGGKVETLTGSRQKDVLIGSSRDNYIRAGDGNDVLQGNGGSDTLKGHDGRDVLRGNDGDDFLDGGAGIDVMTGGAGNDRFVFAHKGDWDRIRDFGDGRDRIHVARIDANESVSGTQDFRFIGDSYLKRAGDLGAYIDYGQNRTYVQGDTDGDGAYDFSIRLDGIHHLEADDFIF